MSKSAVFFGSVSNIAGLSVIKLPTLSSNFSSTNCIATAVLALAVVNILVSKKDMTSSLLPISSVKLPKFIL